jgi:hypothetical protein
MTLAQAAASIGRTVVYLPSNFPKGHLESGVITSVNDTYVFVRYGTNQTSSGTRPEHLELEEPEVRP